MGVLGGIFVLKSGLRILINVMHVSMMNVSMMRVYMMHTCRYDACIYDAANFGRTKKAILGVGLSTVGKVKFSRFFIIYI